MYNVASVYTRLGRYEEAEELLGKAMEITERAKRYGYFLLLGNMYTAQNCLEQGRYDAAERHCLAIIGPEPIVEAVKPQGAVNCRILLGETYRAQGRYKQAERIFNGLVNNATNMQGPVTRLAEVYVYLERFDEAEELFKKAIDKRAYMPPSGRHLILNAMNGLAVVHTKREKFDEAESLFKQVWEERKLALGHDHPRTLETINDLGVLCRKQERYDEAESLLDRALEGRQRKLGDDHPAALQTKHELGLLYLAQSQYDKAETELLKAYQGRSKRLRSGHPHTIETIKQLVRLYQAWGNPGEAGKWTAKLSAFD